MQPTSSRAMDTQQTTGWQSDMQATAGGVKQASVNRNTQMVNYNTTEPFNAATPMSAFGADAYHSETRKVSSVVIDSQPVGEVPDTEDRIRYVEVPTIEEQVKYVTVYEQREVEKRVPKYEIEYVDRVIEVPKIVYKDVRRVDRQVVDRVVERKVPYTVERTRQVPREVKVPMTRIVEKDVEVPGEVIEVPKYYDVENRIEVPRHVDREVPVVVAQTIKPIITESNTTQEVDVLDYEPEVMPVDVHIAKPISSALEFVGQRELKHRLVNVTSGQYNTVLKLLNANASEATKQSLPYVAEYGRVPFAPEHEAHFIVAPPNVEIEGWNRPAMQTQAREAFSLGSHMMVGSHQANEAACCKSTKKKSAVVSQEPEAFSSHHHRHQHSTATNSEVYASSFQQQQRGAPSTHTHSQHRQHRPTSDSTSEYNSAAVNEYVKDGSTVLSQRPHVKSRICC